MCGGIFGGGSSHASTPEVQKVNPVATQVTPESVSNSTSQSAENAKQKRRQGYASTKLKSTSTGTLAGGADTSMNGTGGKKELG